jgi:hypothetical protein
MSSIEGSENMMPISKETEQTHGGASVEAEIAQLTAKCAMMEEGLAKWNVKWDILNQLDPSTDSVAVWESHDGSKKAKAGMGTLPTAEQIRAELNANVVLVGLNISRGIDRPFGNFHPDYPSAQDYKLRHALQDSMFWGAYMTDVIKDKEEKVSGKLMKYLRQNKEFERQNVARFEKDLKKIGAVKPVIVAMGSDAYKILQRNLKGKYKIYKVSHYSAFITKEKLRAEFEELAKQIHTE